MYSQGSGHTLSEGGNSPSHGAALHPEIRGDRFDPGWPEEEGSHFPVEDGRDQYGIITLDFEDEDEQEDAFQRWTLKDISKGNSPRTIASESGF